mgnify:CR=1 FL=1
MHDDGRRVEFRVTGDAVRIQHDLEGWRAGQLLLDAVQIDDEVGKIGPLKQAGQKRFLCRGSDRKGRRMGAAPYLPERGQ